MKKIAYLFTALALLCGCEKAEDFGQPTQGGAASGELPEVIYATVADDDSEGKTRTVVVNDKSVLWNTGDAVSAFFSGTSNAEYQYNGDDAVATAELKLSMVGYTGIELSKSYAVYPYHDDNTSVLDGGVEKLQVNFPAEQTYAENSFGRGANVMVGVGESADDTDFYFRNACGYLVIKLFDGSDYPSKVKSITLTALGGEKIAGKGLITASNGTAPVVAMTDEGSSTITLNCGQGVALGADATEFWFAMPPVTFSEGFKIHVVPTKGLAFEMQTSNQVEITRNEIQPMAALQYTPKTQLPNQFVYTRSDESTVPITFHEKVGDYPFNVNASIKAHYHDARSGKFIIECNAPITGINAYAFSGTNLATVSLPNQLSIIGDYAFYANYINELVIPGSVTLIGDHALRGNDIRRVSFLWGKNQLQIREYDGVLVSEDNGTGAFKDAYLEYIYIDRNIEYTDENGEKNDDVTSTLGLFTNRSGGDFYAELIIGPNMSTIIESMFTGVLTKKLVIPGNITSIGNNAFFNNSKLEEIDFKPSPTGEPLTMGYVEYWGNKSPFYLTNSTYYDKLKTIRLNREIIYTMENPTSVNQGVFSDRRVLETLEIGPQVRTISDYMFAGTQTLTNVTIPNSVTYIGNNAFEGCTALTSVLVSESGATMGNDVFKDCDALKTATLGAQTIGTGVLYDCDALAEVTIKGTVNEIGNDAFYSCPSIKRVTFEPSDAAAPTTLTLGYQTYGTGEEGPFHDSNLETVIWRRNISYTLANMGSADQTDEGIFSKNSALTSVTIGDQVKSIPPYTFAESGLTGSVWIPNTIESIGDKAFYDCDNLSGLTLGYDGLTQFPTIGTGVFDACSNASSIYIKVRNRVHEQFENAANNNVSGWGAYKDNLRWDANFE